VGVIGPAYFGSAIVLVDCDASDASQLFSFDNATGVLSLVGADGGPLCVDAGSTVNCSVAPFSTYAYCNASLGTDVRADDLASRLSAFDWASLLANSNNGVPRLGVPPVTFSEALHGAVCGCGPAYTDPSTGEGAGSRLLHCSRSVADVAAATTTAVCVVVSCDSRRVHEHWLSDELPARDAAGRLVQPHAVAPRRLCDL
jgi:hypothetical protein